jgi:hypothetical protein
MRMKKCDFAVAAYAFNRTRAAPEEFSPAASSGISEEFLESFSGSRKGNSGGAQFQ